MPILAEPGIHTAWRSVPLIFAISMVCASTVLAADSQICAELDRLDYRVACEKSPECMSVKDPDGGSGAYLCVPASNACQEGFEQMRVLEGGTEDPQYDAASACLSKAGCDYVPAGQCYCPPLVLCVCGGGAPPDCVPHG